MISEKHPKRKIYLNLGNWSVILDLPITNKHRSQGVSPALEHFWSSKGN